MSVSWNNLGVLAAGRVFLTPCEQTIAQEQTRRVVLGLALLSLLWGAAQLVLWNGTLQLFGNPNGDYAAPAIVLMLVMLLGIFRQASRALLELFGDRSPALAGVLAALLVLVLYQALTALRPQWYQPEQQIWAPLAWSRPESKIDRVLLLMPLWGAWAMWILPHLCHGRTSEVPLVRALARQCGPLLATAWMGALLLISILYFSYLPWIQLLIPLVAFLTATGGGLLLVRRAGGLDRRGLLAVNLLTQLAFLGAFLACRELRWP